MKSWRLKFVDCGRIRRWLPGVLVTLALAAFLAQALALSARRLQPRYDEVHYLAVARDYQRMGGDLAAIGCYLEGSCLEDNVNPLFDLLLEPFTRGGPRFFADAKLVTIGTALVLFATVWGVTWRWFGGAAATTAMMLLALMPTLAEVSSGVLADVLLAALLVATVAAVAAAQSRGPLAWLGCGAVVGLAYLTKGNGYLALLALASVGLALHGWRLLLRPHLYLALAGFGAVAFFLLWRNHLVYGNPLHNFNDRLLWLDSFEETWATLHKQEWAHIGMLWYLQRHSVVELAWRLGLGFADTLGVLLYTSGLGITAATLPGVDPSAAAAVTRATAGLVVLGLAARGLADRWRSHRAEVLAVIHVVVWFVLAFALGAQGTSGIAARYVLPLAAVLVPHAAYASVTRVLGASAAEIRHAAACAGRVPRPRLPRTSRAEARLMRPVTALVAVALTGKLVWFAPALAENPRAAFAVPADWAATSAWLAAHLVPGERYAIANDSLYSTWDRPHPDPDARWIGLFSAPALELRREIDDATPVSTAPRWNGPPVPITKILVDVADVDWPRYQDKSSPARDTFGPLAFLGWPRCFADGGAPSRFTIYCRPTGSAARGGRAEIG